MNSKENIESIKPDTGLNPATATINMMTKQSSRSKHPASMTKEAVSVMYKENNMTRGQIADYFGTTISTVNGFISRNKLKRNENNNSNPRRMSGTVTKLSKSEQRMHGKDPDHEYCPVCNKSIYFSYAMSRVDYAYKFKTSKGKIVYCCGWSHMLQAKGEKRIPDAVYVY